MNRRDVLSHTLPSIGAIGFIPALLKNGAHSENLTAQLDLIRELDNDSFYWIWNILKDITDEELNWQINRESNTIRWIVGHLNWFEEWTCDAIKDKGLYLIDKQPTNSYQSDNFSEMKERFTKAHEKYDRLIQDLDGDAISRSARYLYNENDKKRADVDLRTILAIHCTHFYGHLYQIRLIRGTYSRSFNTDKSKFDKW